MTRSSPVDLKEAADALLEMVPDFEHGGGRVTSPQGPLKSLSVEQVAPNMVLFYEEKGNFLKPAGWMMLYFLDSEQAARDMKENKIAYPMFLPGSLTMRFGGYSMIDAIWKKRKSFPNEKPEDKASREAMIHVVGALEAYKTPEGLFVDNLSVRPGWRKNSMGLKMMKTLEKHFPGLPITHSATTDAGHKFLKKTGYLKHPKSARGGEHLSDPAKDAVIEALLEDESDQEWIGVDLDGTLAKYTEWKGPTKIGEPIPKMVARIRRWVGHGKKVKIFTARADDERSVNAIKKWLKDNELPDLEVTNLKDEHMTELWDDKAVAVEKNTGEVKEEAEAVVDFLLTEVRRVNPLDMQRSLDNLRRRNPAGYAQLLLLPFGPVPSYAWEDENSEWWSSQEAFDRLTMIRQASIEGIKSARESLTESPEIKTLKKNARQLDPEERAQVMKAGAVWHHGPNGEATPAVRKAVVNGKTWYWCATHRAGRVKPTLKGAIKAFDFVKTTS